MSRAKQRAPLTAIPTPTPLQSALANLDSAINEHLNALVTFEAAIRALQDDDADAVSVTLLHERLRFAERAKRIDAVLREHVAAEGAA